MVVKAEVRTSFLDPVEWWFESRAALLEDPRTLSFGVMETEMVKGSLVCDVRSVLLCQEENYITVLESCSCKETATTVNVCVCSPRMEDLCRLISLILLIKTIYRPNGCLVNDLNWFPPWKKDAQRCVAFTALKCQTHLIRRCRWRSVIGHALMPLFTRPECVLRLRARVLLCSPYAFLIKPGTLLSPNKESRRGN